MSKAYKALKDVRWWLCDNLSDGDAGKVCGMLSVVSRHIAELEDENARLRSCLIDDAENARQIMGENAKLREENAKLRELVRYMHRCYVSGHDWGPWGAPEKQHVEDIMRELRIEVLHD